MTKAVSELLNKVKDRFGEYPKLVQFDNGKEFSNFSVKTLLERHGIKYKSIYQLQ